MNYKDYQDARDAVWRLLIDLRISELPVNTVKVCAELEIKLHYYEPTDESDGMSCYINGMPHIYVSFEVSPERRRFTIAHELGHIILGHVGKYELVNREPSPGGVFISYHLRVNSLLALSFVSKVFIVTSTGFVVFEMGYCL